MTDEEFAASIGAKISDDEFAKSIGAIAVPEAPFYDQFKVALKQGAVASEDLMNRAASGIVGSLAGMFGNTEGRDKVFRAMEEDLKRNFMKMCDNFFDDMAYEGEAYPDPQRPAATSPTSR